jgi:hypothetical protein
VRGGKPFAGEFGNGLGRGDRKLEALHCGEQGSGVEKSVLGLHLKQSFEKGNETTGGRPDRLELAEPLR